MKRKENKSSGSSNDSMGLDDASTLMMSSGSSVVTHGVALDTFARSVPTSIIPFHVRNTLFKAWPGLSRGRVDITNDAAIPWYAYDPDSNTQSESVAKNLTVTVDDAEKWATGHELTSAFGDYADLPLNPATVERWAFWRYDPVASEFDPTMMFEPQVYALDQLSQLYTESCTFHFGYLADIDAEYHRMRAMGPLGKFDRSEDRADVIGFGSADNEPWFQLYHYWRDQIEQAYLTPADVNSPPLVRLPQHLVNANWRISDVLEELAAQMMSGSGLHPDIFVTAEGFKRGVQSMTLGIQGDQEYTDADGNVRFYHPYLQEASEVETTITSPIVETVVTGSGDSIKISPMWTGPVVGSLNVPVQLTAQTTDIDISPLWGVLGKKGLDSNTAVSWMARDTFLNVGLDDGGIVKSDFMTINSLPTSGTLTGYHWWSGHTLNLSEFTMFMRYLGNAIEPEVLQSFIIPKGVLGSPEPLMNRPSGATARSLNNLYNLYSAAFSFNENPARTYTAAHLGPTDHVLPDPSSASAVKLAGVPLTTDSVTARERYWTPSNVTNAEVSDIASAFLPTVIYDLSLFRNIDMEAIAQTDDATLRSFLSRALGNVRSMRTKVEKPVYIPAGVSAPEATYASGVGAGAIELVGEILYALGGGAPRFGLGHAGFTDVRTYAKGNSAKPNALVTRGILTSESSGISVTHGSNYDGITASYFDANLADEIRFNGVGRIMSALSAVGIPGIGGSSLDNIGSSVETEIPLALRSIVGITANPVDEPAGSTSMIGSAAGQKLWQSLLDKTAPSHVLSSPTESLLVSALCAENMPVRLENTWLTPRTGSAFGDAVKTGFDYSLGSHSTASAGAMAKLGSNITTVPAGWVGGDQYDGTKTDMLITQFANYAQALVLAAVPYSYSIHKDGQQLYVGNLFGEIEWMESSGAADDEGGQYTFCGYHMNDSFGDFLMGEAHPTYGDNIDPGCARSGAFTNSWGMSRQGQRTSPKIIAENLANPPGTTLTPWETSGSIQCRVPMATPAELAAQVALPMIEALNLDDPSLGLTVENCQVNINTKIYLYEDTEASRHRMLGPEALSGLQFANTTSASMNTSIRYEPLWHMRTMGSMNAMMDSMRMVSGVPNNGDLFYRDPQYAIQPGDEAPYAGVSTQSFSWSKSTKDGHLEVSLHGDFTPSLGRESRHVYADEILSAKTDDYECKLVDYTWTTGFGNTIADVQPDSWCAKINHIGYPVAYDEPVVQKTSWKLFGTDPYSNMYKVDGTWSDPSIRIDFDVSDAILEKAPVFAENTFGSYDDFHLLGPIGMHNLYQPEGMSVDERNAGNPTNLLQGSVCSDFFAIQVPNSNISGIKFSGLAPYSMAGATYTYPDDPEYKMMYRPWRNIVDASVMKELKLTFANDGEDPSPLAGLLGIKTIGTSRQFRFADLMDAGQPETFILEKAMSKTRLIDPSYRSVLTFSKLALLDPSSQRHTVPDVIAEENDKLFNYPGKYASAFQSDNRVYNRNTIRDIQLGRQYQRLG